MPSLKLRNICAHPVTASFAVLMLAAPGMVFLAHATGGRHWDLPKGGAEPGELAEASAIRETLEETGIVLTPGSLKDFGVFDYRRDKRLHIFAIRVSADMVSPDACKCTSFFNHHISGRPIAEVDRFAWVPFLEIPERCAKNMARVLTEDLVLPQILEDLPMTALAL